MSLKLKEFRENGLISEPEVLDLITSYNKLTKLGLLSNECFDEVLNKLGIERLNDKQFKFYENSIYTMTL